ncbi:MAG: DUF4384 domain-containing protein [Deltaproteobacteria bacterium]|nr:DUF4384 domain-containing protein [Deltaproteobacteria bacterium]MBW2387582.1 DUF4384 domain-containing protein [Deltaproteobacteria bacterium]MBW2723283.1 DUF4384 domain-containing protein [Deltaproteobacteria bacterium]
MTGVSDHRAIVRRCVLTAALVLIAGASWASDEGAGYAVPEVRKLDSRGTVEVRASVVASDDESPSHARSRAMGLARQAAVEFVAGVKIKTGTLSFEQVRGSDSTNLLQVLTSVRADALMVQEKLIRSRTIPMDNGGYRVAIVMRGRVLDHSDTRDSSFRTEVKLPNTHLLEGDEVKLSVRSSKDARIYVIGITDEGATVLLPNSFHPDTTVRAGRWLEFPDEALYKRGVRLVAEVPNGKRSVREALLVVALKGRLTLDSIKPRSGESFRQVEASDTGHLVADLLQPLLDIPSGDWSFDQIVYEVTAR